MFQKPFHIKSQSVLKGSDRKKIKSVIASQSPLFTSDILQEILPQKSDVQLAKVSLHNGELANILLHEKRPVFFEFGGRYFPTVYTAWRYPESLNYFSTWSPVITKLYGGADLMLPGVVVRTEITIDTFSHITSGLPVAVNDVDNKAALAIGETCMDGVAMVSSGMRGKGVYIRHCYGDHLWAMGSKVTPPIIPQSSPPEASEANPEGSAADCLDLQNLSVDEVNQVAAEVSAAGNSMTSNSLTSNDKNLEQSGKDDDDGVLPLSGMSEDEKLKKCFLYAIKKKVKKAQLPMSTSSFYRDCITVCCPPGMDLDLKKTSYKKLMPFLLEMRKQEFLVVKETSKGVHSIIDINYAHPELKSFTPWDLPEAEVASVDTSQEYVYQPPEIVELLSINAQTLPLFSKLGFSKGDALSLSDVRSQVTNYIKQHQLQHETNRQLVVLDSPLTDVVVTRNDGYVETMKWNDIFSRLSNLLSNVYQMRFPTGAVVTKKGKPPQVQVKLETRTGNKKVTLIRNLDSFGIDCKMIAKDLRSLKACSTSVQEHSGGFQVLAQGNHASFINKLLKEKYRIPLKYLDIPS